MKKISGSGVALVTPFLEGGDIDFEGLTKLVNHCFDGGIDYLVVMGTTAENPVLQSDEKLAILAHVIKVNAKKLPIVYGIGGNCTAEVTAALKSTNLDGVDAILSVSPYYNKPTQEGVYQHFKAVSESTNLPIIVYNVPGRTSSNMQAETTLRLAHDFDNIVAIKEASGELEQVMKICNERPSDFLVISGDDNLTLPMIASGGNGVISVSGQAFPATFSQMVNAAIEGDFVTARQAHYKLFEVTKMLFAEGNPGGVKAALHHKGICGKYMRLPLWPISKELEESISKEILKHDL